jgi:hypothetical protein
MNLMALLKPDLMKKNFKKFKYDINDCKKAALMETDIGNLAHF